MRSSHEGWGWGWGWGGASAGCSCTDQYSPSIIHTATAAAGTLTENYLMQKWFGGFYSLTWHVEARYALQYQLYLAIIFTVRFWCILA